MAKIAKLQRLLDEIGVCDAAKDFVRGRVQDFARRMEDPDQREEMIHNLAMTVGRWADRLEEATERGSR